MIFSPLSSTYESCNVVKILVIYSKNWQIYRYFPIEENLKSDQSICDLVNFVINKATESLVVLGSTINHGLGIRVLESTSFQRKNFVTRHFDAIFKNILIHICLFIFVNKCQCIGNRFVYFPPAKELNNSFEVLLQTVNISLKTKTHYYRLSLILNVRKPEFSVKRGRRRTPLFPINV